MYNISYYIQLLSVYQKFNVMNDVCLLYRFYELKISKFVWKFMEIAKAGKVKAIQ